MSVGRVHPYFRRWWPSETDIQLLPLERCFEKQPISSACTAPTPENPQCDQCQNLGSPEGVSLVTAARGELVERSGIAGGNRKRPRGRRRPDVFEAEPPSDPPPDSTIPQRDYHPHIAGVDRKKPAAGRSGTRIAEQVRDKFASAARCACVNMALMSPGRIQETRTVPPAR